MDYEKELEGEIKRLENIGYRVIHIGSRSIRLEKHVAPTKLRIAIWILASFIVPFVGMYFVLFPVRVYEFFKGQKYDATIRIINGEIETT